MTSEADTGFDYSARCVDVTESVMQMVSKRAYSLPDTEWLRILNHQTPIRELLRIIITIEGL